MQLEHSNPHCDHSHGSIADLPQWHLGSQIKICPHLARRAGVYTSSHFSWHTVIMMVFPC